MKKIIAFALMLALCVMALAGCGSTEEKTEAPEVSSDLSAAKEYLSTMYEDMPETHVNDFTVVGKVMIGTAAHNVEWSADAESVKIEKGEDNMVTVDIDEENPEEVKYTLTAVISNENGESETVTFAQRVPAAIIITEDMTNEQIVEAVYGLEKGVALNKEVSLTGKIVKVNDAFNEKYKNITVTIQIGELADKPIECFRLSGDGAESLAEGDEITVTGIIKNYKGKIEFDQGCKLN